MSFIKLVECPRDAMQGINPFIPTDLKIRYLQQLLQVGVDTLDFGSFVSPKAVPQLADTAEVLAGLDLTQTSTNLLAIVANLRGAQEACSHNAIRYVGYPFSLSETFQQRNTRRSMSDSLLLVREIQELCLTHNKTLVVYLSMGFGNPYGDPWDEGVLDHWAKKMANLGITILSLADTVGSAEPEVIQRAFNRLIPQLPAVEFGAHFHATPAARMGKIKAAYESGCTRFDTALMGFGGCPFAEDELVGNIATESLIEFCKVNGIQTSLDLDALGAAQQIAQEVFAQPH
ncbi:MAG: hydroxymethylglutaryl-CoA lyase [Bacteroidota bacterium]